MIPQSRLLAAVVTCAVMAGALTDGARADAPPANRWDPLTVVERLEHRLGSAHRLEVRSRARHSVAFQICPGPAEDPGTCSAFRVDDPSVQCGSFAIGPWCLEMLTGRADSEVERLLRQVLAEDAERAAAPPSSALPAPPPSEWEATAPPGANDPLGEPPPRWQIRLQSISPGWLSALLLAGPWLIGLAAGRTWRRLLGPVRRAPVVAVLAVVAFALLAGWLGTRVRVNVWDGVSVGAILAGTALFVARDAWRGIDRRGLVVALVSLGLALGVAEALCRRFLPPPPPHLAESGFLFMPRFDPDSVPYERRHGSSHFAYWRLQRADGCALVYPERYRRPFLDRAGRNTPPARAWLHIGDSMVFGPGVPPWQTFTSLLERHDPGVAQVNAAASGMSLDFYYSIAHHWAPLLPTRLAVVYLFLNDPGEIDRYMPCCREQPLLAYGSSGVTERCPSPDWEPGYGRSLEWFIRNGTPPFPILHAGSFSVLARQIRAASLQRFNEQRFDPDHSRVEWDHFERALQAMRDDLREHNVPLVAVVLPLRSALEAEDSRDTGGYRDYARMKSIAEKAAIPTLDPWDDFAALVKRHGADAFFLPGRDVHFNARGHAAMAEWLSTRLPRYAAP